MWERGGGGGGARSGMHASNSLRTNQDLISLSRLTLCWDTDIGWVLHFRQLHGCTLRDESLPMPWPPQGPGHREVLLLRIRDPYADVKIASRCYM